MSDKNLKQYRKPQHHENGGFDRPIDDTMRIKESDDAFKAAMAAAGYRIQDVVVTLPGPMASACRRVAVASHIPTVSALADC